MGFRWSEVQILSARPAESPLPIWKRAFYLTRGGLLAADAPLDNSSDHDRLVTLRKGEDQGTKAEITSLADSMRALRPYDARALLRSLIHLETMPATIDDYDVPPGVDLDSGRTPEAHLGCQVQPLALDDKVEVALHPFDGPARKPRVAEERREMAAIRSEDLDPVVAPISHVDVAVAIYVHP